MSTALFPRPLAPEPLRELFLATRARSLAIVDGLHPEDMTAQSMEDASPTKWHLAHTTWFFEEFVLRPGDPGYRSPDERFAYLFNSYYVQAGPRFVRARRGLVTRPTVEEILEYRHRVDALVRARLDDGAAPADLIELGCHHEMQHQELMLTDLLHLLSHNPLHPAYRAPEPLAVSSVAPLVWHAVAGGVVPVGHGAGTFAFDCESPAHEALVPDLELASRAVTAGEWIDFIADGGYEDARHWLSDGWATREREGWDAPGYWWLEEGRWMNFGLRGAQPVDEDAPVAHVSYFEADAYARWVGARLPTEFEREHALAATRDGRVPRGRDGALLEDERLRPARAAGTGLAQLDGDVWEWTASAYLPYPGFRAPDGAVGEYNGKFMNGQYVLRGGSALTPRAQLRDTYRNFFAPHHRFQMSGLRLARDAGADAERFAPVRRAEGPGPARREGTDDDAFVRSFVASLEREPRVFEPKWFYDAAGSALFEEICRTDAYYVTRVETALLERHAAEIAASIGPDAVLFEPGAGAAAKVRPLLRALDTPRAYVPGDIDLAHLERALGSLRRERPGLAVHPLALDFTRPLELPASLAGAGAVTVFFPGSTIGNFAPDEARALLARFAGESGATQALIGFDLPPGPGKDEARLVRAYDDEEGVTAAFNLNLLERANRELDAGFDVGAFRHVACYDAALGRIEMYLVAGRAHEVRVGGRTFGIAAGERLLTECSWKYSLGRFEALAAAAGWRVRTTWRDADERFALAMLER